MPYVTFQSHQVFYQDLGQGPTLIFLHGWPTNSLLWSSQIEHLKANYRIIVFDWLGFGQSDKPLDLEYSFTNQLNQLEIVISTLVSPTEKLTLIAHDIGGPPAILWAAEHSNRIDQLILLNTVIYLFKTPLDAFSGIILSIPFLRDLFVSPFGLKQVMRTNTKNRSLETKQAIQSILSPYRDAPSALKQKTIHEPLSIGRKKELISLKETYKKTAVKKHLIIAKKDPLCFKHIQKLKEDNPKVPSDYLENCGHYLPIDRPKELNTILERILKN